MCKILLIDDDVEDFLIIEEALAELNAVDMVQYAENGPQGLKMLEQRYNQRLHLPFVIILDINMPIMNGSEVLKRIKSDPRFASIPAIIYSTAINPVEEEECKKLGACSCIAKPSTMDAIRTFGETLLSFCQQEVDVADSLV